MLLFLLLVIPVGIYIFQTQNVGETRSKAMEKTQYGGDMGETFKRLSCARECPSGYVKVPNKQMPRLCDCVTVAEASGTPKSTNKSVKTPTPTKSITKRCNAKCTSDTTCGEGMVCVKIPNDEKDTCNGKSTCSVCRHAQCYGVYDCWCYNLANVSPTPAPACNSTCTSDASCGGSMICVRTADGDKCRNPQCYGVEDCMCYSTVVSGTVTPTPLGEITTPPPDYYPTPTTYIPQTYDVPVQGSSERTFAGLLASPTPTPLSMLVADVTQSALTNVQPILTVNAFYNAKKQTNPTFVLTGTSNPEAQLEISIFPDGVIGSVKADSMGNWQYSQTQSLKNGEKQLTIIAKAQSGGQMTKTDTFSVMGAFQFPFAAIVFSGILIFAASGYFWFMSKKDKKTPPAGPYITTTVPGFQQPESNISTSPYGFGVPRTIPQPPVSPQTPGSPEKIG